MVFRARWTELKKLGSKSKGPTGLSNLHTSIEPSKTKKGVRGQDYFVGEEELMRYLDRLDLDRSLTNLTLTRSLRVVRLRVLRVVRLTPSMRVMRLRLARMVRLDIRVVW
ncbi:hypothetical protein PC118_g23881 [Phytophthora cactorum]|uniref:Uncharacterized protein n=1 Tax=Phytophthora cactorum TaxID=29920 RepID=A0A8T1ETS5_9STRA|nr:hypothetical protein PC118_g23881 [Phytophthora cactorum]